MRHLNKKDLSVEEQVLWNRVKELWDCSLNRDFNTVEKSIHPKYTGWDSNTLLPHDRKYVIQSIADPSVRVLQYEVIPLGVSVYDRIVGIVNYRYKTHVCDRRGNVRILKGICTETYLRQDSDWILINEHSESDTLQIATVNHS